MPPGRVLVSCSRSRGCRGGSALSQLVCRPRATHWRTISPLLGAGTDLQIYHDGTQSVIKDTGGKLQIFSEDIEFYDADAGYYMDMVADGGVRLAYDTSWKLETTSAGVSITGNASATGTLTAAGLTCSGYADFTGLLSEACTVTAGKLSDNTNLDAANGNVFLFT